MKTWHAPSVAPASLRPSTVLALARLVLKKHHRDHDCGGDWEYDWCPLDDAPSDQVSKSALLLATSRCIIDQAVAALSNSLALTKRITREYK